MSRPVKRRKTQKAVEEISFDPDARHEYLTGFRKRKQQRIKHAQEEAAKKERAFKIEHRKQIREQRDKDIKAHVEAVNAMLKKGKEEEANENDAQEQSPEGPYVESPEESSEEDIGHEDEYVDEDKHTTVTIEPMNMSGSENGSEEQNQIGEGSNEDKTKHEDSQSKEAKSGQRRVWTKENPNKGKPKKKRKKFRYESKVERKQGRLKQKAKKSAAARARRNED